MLFTTEYFVAGCSLRVVADVCKAVQNSMVLISVEVFEGAVALVGSSCDWKKLHKTSATGPLTRHTPIMYAFRTTSEPFKLTYRSKRRVMYKENEL